MAYDVFKRRHNEELSNLKSSLNYIKSVASFRRMAYEKERHQELLNEYVDWDNDKYLETCRATLEKANHQRTVDLMEELLRATPKIVKRSIPKSLQHDAIYQNLYTSCLLTFVNQITLDRRKQADYTERQNKESFDEAKFLNKYRDKDIILWHLDESYATIVQVTINKAKNAMLEEIKEIIVDESINVDDFNAIMNSTYGDNNDLCKDN